MDPGDQQLFKPARAATRRLGNYSFANHVPCISADICLLKDTAKQMHVGMARLVTKLTKAKVRQLHEGSLRVQKQKFRFKGAPPWNMAAGAPDLKNVAEKYDSTILEHPRTGPDPPSSFQLTCHKCGSARQAAKNNLVVKAQWGTLYCSTCMLSRKACKWCCSCGQPWHTCPTHREIGLACRKPSFPKFRRKVGNKRPSPQLGQDICTVGSDCTRRHVASIIQHRDESIEANKNTSQEGKPGSSGGAERHIQTMPISLECNPLVEQRNQQGDTIPMKVGQAYSDNAQMDIRSNPVFPSASQADTANKNTNQVGEPGGLGEMRHLPKHMPISLGCDQPVEQRNQQGETSPKKVGQATVSSTRLGTRSKPGSLKRSLPVAWGTDIFIKVPRLAERFSRVLVGETGPEQAKGRKRLFGKQPDPLACARSGLPRPPE